jgi:hypothetical protein
MIVTLASALSLCISISSISALGLLANLKETREVKGVGRVEATSITTVIKEFVCDTKMEIMRLKKDLQMKDRGACLVDHDQSCDNSKTMTKNKIMTFSPVLIPRQG